MEPRLKCSEIYETLHRTKRRLDKNDETNVVDVKLSDNSETDKMTGKDNKSLNL